MTNRIGGFVGDYPGLLYIIHNVTPGLLYIIHNAQDYNSSIRKVFTVILLSFKSFISEIDVSTVSDSVGDN